MYIQFFEKDSKLNISIFIFPPSVLKTFLHDPLVEWSKPAKGGLSRTQANETGEIVNEKVSAVYAFRVCLHASEQHT